MTKDCNWMCSDSKDPIDHECGKTKEDLEFYETGLQQIANCLNECGSELDSSSPDNDPESSPDYNISGIVRAIYQLNHAVGILAGLSQEKTWRGQTKWTIPTTET